MPITLLDIILLAVMLISGLLALIRGFMREILSIGAWGVAAVVTLYSYSRVLPMAKQYFNSDMVAAGVSAGGIFLGTLLIVSIITARVSDMVLDSRVGRARSHAWLPVRAGSRLDYCRCRLPVLCMAGTRSQPAGMGAQRQVKSCSAKHRAMVDVDVAG